MKMTGTVLEYHVAKPRAAKKPRWGFRFKTARGKVLLESAACFDSRSEAERGFVSMMNSIATNQYTVQVPGSGSNN